MASQNVIKIVFACLALLASANYGLTQQNQLTDTVSSLTNGLTSGLTNGFAQGLSQGLSQGLHGMNGGNQGRFNGQMSYPGQMPNYQNMQFPYQGFPNQMMQGGYPQMGGYNGQNMMQGQYPGFGNYQGMGMGMGMGMGDGSMMRYQGQSQANRGMLGGLLSGLSGGFL